MPLNIIWTVLPNGTDGQNLKLSIYASLRSGDSLPDWPSLIAGLSGLSLVFADADGNELDTLPVILNLGQVSTGGGSPWNETFPSSTDLPARVFRRLDQRPRVSFPIKKIREQIHALYKDVAEAFPDTQPPVIEGYNDNNNTIDSFGDVLFAAGRPVNRRLNGSEPHPPLAELDSESPFYQAFRFYRREIDNTIPTLTEPPATPTVDFHQAVGMLGDHPALLRGFGLIVDATLAAVPDGAARVRLARPASGFDSDAVHERPWTAFTRDGDTFLPAPRADLSGGSDQSGGFLKLGDGERFEIQQLDVDGIALKFTNFAAMAVSEFEQLDGYLPNIRTGGFIVGRVGRSTQMGDQLARSTAFDQALGNSNESAGTVLYAEDLTRGYRTDVLHESLPEAEWRSLCRRRGHFLLGSSRTRVPASGEITDEGYVKASAASTAAGQDPNDSATPLYVHESLFGWDGWSQVIKPPGRSQKFVSGEGDVVQRIENEAAPDTGFEIEQQFQVEPGTLPKLRFGHSYRLRSRVVDVAGNSLPLSAQSSGSGAVSESQFFRRYEPVPQPVLVLRRRVVEGESIENIVIRSRSGDGDIPEEIFFSWNDRHVAPPNASLDMAIMHGMLDSLFSDPKRSYDLALKSEGTFLDPVIWDGKGHKVDVPGIEILNPPTLPGAPEPPPPIFPEKRGDGLKPGQYVVHAHEHLLLPYLPDPMAVGFAVKDAREKPRDEENDPVLEGERFEVGTHKLYFNGSWPDVSPARLIVRSTNDDQPSVKIEGDKLVIELPPATVLPLEYSSLPDPSGIESLAIFKLMDEERQSEHAELAADGQHWMITPRRRVVAVHAVERPLRAAKFQEIAVNPPRATGETFVHLGAVIDNHSRSTGQLDIEASWTDPVDRLTEPGPTDEARSGRVHSHRPEYRDSLTSVPPLPTSPPNAIPKHEFGDTKHRYVDYRADATTRYLEYFPLDLVQDSDIVKLRGLPTTVNILSSARPDAPQVLYVIPTFRWETPAPSPNTLSRRVGRGLRVYLSRPWFSSGIDELLGVVLPVVEDGAVPAAARRYVSQWGSDPIWDGTFPEEELQPEHFQNTETVSGTNLTIAEDASVRVQAVGYPVQYNAERQLWFADIELDATAAYFPFVRLALARYQPHSVSMTEEETTTNVHLSRVVRAEFAQLVNDRAATVQIDTTSVKVTVVGFTARNQLGEDIVSEVSTPPGTPAAPPGYQFNRDAGAARIVTIHLERRDRQATDLDWAQVGSQEILPSFLPTSPTSSSETLWTGSLPRPSGRANSEYRLVIREVEVYDADEDVAEMLPITVPSERTVRGAEEDRFIRGRVVYLDTILLKDVEK
jgi:hypothetical protein